MFYQVLLAVTFFLFACQLNASDLSGPMSSGEAHKEMEDSLRVYDLKAVQGLPREMVITWFICPKLRLTAEDIQNLVRNSSKIVQAEGLWVIGDLTVVSGIDHLAFLAAEAGSGHGQELLVESGRFNPKSRAFEFTYRRADDAGGGETVTLRLSNASIKDPHNPVPQYLKNLMERPGGTPKPRHVAPRRPPPPQTVYVQQQPPVYQQPPQPQTVIVEEHTPYPSPYYGPYIPPVIVGGWGWGPGWHHHRR